MRLQLAMVFSALSLISSAHAITIDFVTVDNAGNSSDPETGFGAVAYTYKISKTEITNAQYAEFLNASAASDPFELYNTAMGSSTWGGIIRSGSPGNYTYAVKTTATGVFSDGADYAYANKPVVYVSWYDAIRFVNWLHNGQGSGGTETGAYTLTGGSPTPSNGLSITRNKGAKFWLPSEDEWYKAAYHNSAAGTEGSYFDFATGTDTPPDSDNPASLNVPNDGNVANFFRNDNIANDYNDGYAVSGTGNFTYPLTDVGAYSLAKSPYGTFDQSGNAREWNEVRLGASSRGTRGGAFDETLVGLAASGRNSELSTLEDNGTGFRVATVPEPGSLLLTLLSLASYRLLVPRTARR